jgi:hypothetical protein
VIGEQSPERLAILPRSYTQSLSPRDGASCFTFNLTVRAITTDGVHCALIHDLRVCDYLTGYGLDIRLIDTLYTQLGTTSNYR